MIGVTPNKRIKLMRSRLSAPRGRCAHSLCAVRWVRLGVLPGAKQ